MMHLISPARHKHQDPQTVLDLRPGVCPGCQWSQSAGHWGLHVLNSTTTGKAWRTCFTWHSF